MIRIKDYTSDILKNINLDIESNLCILGSNGAGKSTLAKLLCGLTPSTHIHIFGKRLDKLDAKTRAAYINYIPPKLEVFDPYISLSEYLLLSRLYGDITLKSALQRLNLQHLKDKPLQTLSSGEQQLTLIASALLHGAKITIFDEPSANLDPKKTKQIFHILKEDTTTTKIVITHDLNIAYKLGYDIVFIKDGEVVFHGSNEVFFSDTEQFFGDAIMQTIDKYFVVKL